jgi:hypothetical protein
MLAGQAKIHEHDVGGRYIIPGAEGLSIGIKSDLATHGPTQLRQRVTHAVIVLDDMNRHATSRD